MIFAWVYGPAGSHGGNPIDSTGVKWERFVRDGFMGDRRRRGGTGWGWGPWRRPLA